MASPRSMWSGAITFGLVSIPVSVGKAWSETRANGIKDICTCHGQPIDRSERCAITGADATGKQKGIEVGPEKFQPLDDAEVGRIEDETGSEVLAIEDYRPLWDLPLDYANGTYYVRYAPPKKKSTAGRDAFAALVAALKRYDTGAVVKWCTGANQRLCVLRAGDDDTLLMQQLPFTADLRLPGRMEHEHKAERVDPAAAEQVHNLLGALAPEGDYDHGRFVNDGVQIREAVIDRFIAEYGEKGEQQKQKGEQQEQGEGGQKVPDLMAQLQASIAQQKATQGQKA